MIGISHWLDDDLSTSPCFPYEYPSGFRDRAVCWRGIWFIPHDVGDEELRRMDYETFARWARSWSALVRQLDLVELGREACPLSRSGVPVVYGYRLGKSGPRPSHYAKIVAEGEKRVYYEWTQMLPRRLVIVWRFLSEMFFTELYCPLIHGLFEVFRQYARDGTMPDDFLHRFTYWRLDHDDGVLS